MVLKKRKVTFSNLGGGITEAEVKISILKDEEAKVSPIMRNLVKQNQQLQEKLQTL